MSSSLQAVNSQILKGHWILSDLKNGDKLETLSQDSPLTVSISGSTVSLQNTAGTTAQILRTEETCDRLGVWVVNAVLFNAASAVQG